MPDLGSSMDVDALREGPGTRIGPYKLVRQIGEGGFGAVFLAEQEEPVRREVALKIIKLGMDTREVVARFEQERQALAMMEHPNIARVIDAGATATGRPYFVMELVKGEPISMYCDAHELTIEDRLELFAQVCTAVQHAHTKGIIHRDLKPSNVLVTTQDGRPQAKVIDFGIAKATAQKLTDATFMTAHNQVIGTLQYMSPEQAAGSVDIDTRTDVYSLGVMLYELLTGTTPFDPRMLRQAMFSEAQRMICEIEPPKPSTRLAHSTDTLKAIAARRRTEPKRLGGIVRGELDWIVMKALAKERQRRYDSAHGLAADVRRYLDGEAITAAPPSAAYRFKKLVLRNKVPVAAGALVVLAILVGSALAVAGFVQAKRQRDAAVAAETRALAEAARATKAEAHAVGEAERAASAEARAVEEAQSATQIAGFLVTMLEGVGPQVALGRDTALLREIVDNTALQVDKELSAQPKVASRLLNIIAKVYNQLAIYDKAEKAARRSVQLLRDLPGDNGKAIARALHEVAMVLESTGRYDEAKATYQEAYDLFCAAGDGETSNALSALGGVGAVLYRVNQVGAAESIFRKVAEGQRKLTQGKDTKELAYALDRLSLALNKDPERAAESEALVREVLAMRRRLFGDVHPDVALSLSNLAVILADQRRFDEAIELAEQSIEQHRKLFGERHPRTASALVAQADHLWSAGRLADAVTCDRLALDINLENLGADHRTTLNNRFDLGSRLDKVGDYAGAEAEYRALLAWGRANYVPGDNRTTAVIMLVANAVMRQQRYTEAEALYREALEARRARLPVGDPKLVETQNALADCLVAQGRRADAEPLLLTVEEDTATLGPSATAHVDALKRLVAFYTAWNAAEPGRGYDAVIAEWQAKLDAVQ